MFFFVLLSCGRTNKPLSSQEYGVLSVADSAFIHTAFEKADRCMDRDYYDSAQRWLNQIHEKVSYRTPSLFSYYLTSRQAEVYYYNNLGQLGLQEGKRALAIATNLNDDELKADALNFCGLFLQNAGKPREAIPYFRKGIALRPFATDKNGYLPLSEPHHLYGNLSEAYDAIGETKKALYYAEQSLQAARKIDDGRGIANALLNMGNYLLHLKQTGQATIYFRRAIVQSRASKDVDITLNAYGLLAECALLHNDEPAALQWLDSGFALMATNSQLNSFYTLGFLDHATTVYKHAEAFPLLAATLEKRSAIQQATQLRHNQQYETILLTSLRNETRILHLGIAEAQSRESLATTRLYVVILVVALLGAAFIAYRYYARQRLKLAHLRNKISRDLHDEIGSTLSGIALYSYITRQQNSQQQTADAERSLAIIEKNATDMVKKLSDIVWVVNADHDSFESLLARLESYARETAAAKNITIRLRQDQQIARVQLPMDARKNIYLCCKEAVNNAIKYSNGTTISLEFSLQNGFLLVTISDDGIGFDPADRSIRGSGIANMEARASELHAALHLESAPGKGTRVTLSCKITQ